MSGGLFGGGGGLLGSILGALLAPETFGLSIPVGAAIGGGLGGVGGNLLGDAITGQPVDPLGVVTSGLGGAAGGFLGGPGIASAADAVGSAAGGAFDALGGAGPSFAGSAAPAAAGVGGTSAAAAASPFGDVGSLINSLGLGDTVGAAAPTVASSAPALTGGGTVPGQLSQLTGGALDETGSLATGGGDIAQATPTAATGGGGTGAMGGFTPTTGAIAEQAAYPTTGVLNPATFPSESSITGDILGGSLGTSTADATKAALGGSGLDLGSLGGIWSAIKPYLGPGLVAANLGKQALGTSIPGADQLGANSVLLRNLAGQLAGASTGTGISGQVASQYGQGGLTPEQQAQSQQLLKNQINQIRAHYANLGLSGSDSEKQAIIQAQNANLAGRAGTMTSNSQLAVQADQASKSAANTQAATAISAMNAASTPTVAIAQQQLADDAALSDALAKLAAAALYTPQATA